MTLDGKYAAKPGVDLNLDPELERRLRPLLDKTGMKVLSGRRDTKEQEALFRRYYTTTPIPNRPRKWWQGQWWYQRKGMPEAAIPGTSRHERGLAVDISLPPGGVERLNAIEELTKACVEFGLTNRRVKAEPWHTEVDPASTGPAKGSGIDFGFLNDLEEDVVDWVAYVDRCYLEAGFGPDSDLTGRRYWVHRLINSPASEREAVMDQMETLLGLQPV